MIKWILAAFGIAIIAVGGYLGYNKYANAKIVETTFPAIKNSALRVTNDLNLFSSSDSKITYKELFEKLDTDVAEIEKRILDVQTAGTASTQDRMSPIEEYLRSAQELLRAEANFFRKSLAVSNAIDWTKRAQERYDSASTGYEIEYAVKARSDAVTDAKKASIEQQSAALVMSAAVIEFGKSQRAIAPFVPGDALVASPVIDAAQSSLAKVNAAK